MLENFLTKNTPKLLQAYATRKSLILPCRKCTKSSTDADRKEESHNRSSLLNDSVAVHPGGTNRFRPSSGPTSLLYSSRFPRGCCRGKRPRSRAIATAEVRESTPSFA